MSKHWIFSALVVATAACPLALGAVADD